MSPIPSMIYNAAVGGHVTNSQQIIDENLNREQNDINEEVVAVPYNATTPNGMGKIVLKKNDNFKQVVEAQTNGNTIFVIKYDFTLTGNVNIPANCIFQFEGGSINAGSGENMNTITGNLTKISGTAIYINPNITFAGSFVLNTVYVDWFIKERTYGGYVDNAINAAIQLAKLALTSLTFGGNVQSNWTYKTSVGNFDISGLTVYGNGATIMALGQNGNSLFVSSGKIIVKDLTLSTFPYPTQEITTNEKGIKLNDYNGVDVIIDGCNFDGFDVGIHIYKSWNVRITNCNFMRGRVGILSEGLSANNIITNCTIRVTTDITTHNRESACITISGGTEGYIISNNTILGGVFGIQLLGGSNTIISDNIIDLQKGSCIRQVGNNVGLFVHHNYLGLHDEQTACFVYIIYHDVQNNEDCTLWYVDNKFKLYGRKNEQEEVLPFRAWGFFNINSSHIKSMNITGNCFQTTFRYSNRLPILSGQNNAWTIDALVFTNNFYDVYPVAQDSDIWPQSSDSHFSKLAEDNNIWI